MTVAVAKRVNPRWKRFQRGRTITVQSAVVARPQDRFFLMGSCFAPEMRRALAEALGASHVVPDYAALDFDAETCVVDQLPDNPHLNTYSAFSVVQEIERALGLWSPAEDDVWQLDGQVQCPYRRVVLAPDTQMLAKIGKGLDGLVREGLEAADHFVFTFGMTEVFVNTRSGRIACQIPGYSGGGGHAETEFRNTGYQENRDAILRIADLIAAIKPQAKVFMTVSPVPLARTFSGQDIYCANMTSKTTLRAVLAEVERLRTNVVYFPSYEIVMHQAHEAFLPDGRHIHPAVVESITDTFLEAHLGLAPAGGMSANQGACQAG